MKILLLAAILLSLQLKAQKKFHDLQVETQDSSIISLKNYAGDKVIIVIASPEQLMKRGIPLIDSIEQQYKSIKIVIIPSEDTTVTKNEEAIRYLQSVGTEGMLVAKLSNVQKGNEKQSPIIKFLTDVKENTHFDDEIDPAFQLYVVNEEGELYAIMSSMYSQKALHSVLNQKIIR